MLSSDQRLLAFAASAGEHDHWRADYDVYLVETDPERLEAVGRAVRVAPHPATDRFPDVWVAPQPLGVHSGEAPLTVRLAAGPPRSGESTKTGPPRSGESKMEPG